MGLGCGFGEVGRHTLGPLYNPFWYFSASLMHLVWDFHCPGPAKVVLQSRQVTELWHIE